MSASREGSGLGGVAAVVGAGLLMVVCCAAPLLVTGGALGGVGGWLDNPWLITVGAVVLLTGAAYALRCRARRRGARPEDCCPIVPGPPPTKKTPRAVTSGEQQRPPRGEEFFDDPGTSAQAQSGPGRGVRGVHEVDLPDVQDAGRRPGEHS
ncbi:hypothetical protein [Streptomyces sp. NBC_01481]|uniref:hypothetical protein n=1 Tax=Streptomyces sp. NBC_01481 TaxID=2975869 RepID=UPI0022518344|nr:hypothetical protein [Streptomyces sp. NBC_01481]MCX4581536.1 hypothetical protein [Streptomyces sp. NBC_01481]